jgi:hypothetical protein
MCNYLNKYINLNDAHYIRYTSLWNLFKKCIPYLSGIFSKLCSNKKNPVTMVSKHTLVQISLYPWLNGQYMLPYYSVLSRTEKGYGIFFLLKFNALPQFLKVGRAIAPSSFAHEVVLVKFELQTHMEHLSSCQSGFLVVCASQSSVFWVFVIFCQPLNICLFVMLYLYIYIIYCY